MEFLFFLAIICGIIIAIVHFTNKTKPSAPPLQNPSHFLRFLASYAARDDESHALQTAARVSDEYFAQTMKTLPSPRQLPASLLAPLTPAAAPHKPATPSYTGVNALLYTASLFIVGGAALIISSNVTDSIKIIGLLLIAGGFYAAGLMMYSRFVRLRPAAIAFLGTGLAIVPIWGVSLAAIGNLSAGLAWCITSIVGLLAFVGALQKIRHDLLGYFTLGFVLSLAASVPTAIEAPHVLAYVGLLVGGALIGVIYRLSGRGEFQQSSLLIAALTPLFAILIAASYSQLPLIQIVILLAASALYHALYGMVTKESDYRQLHQSGARIGIILGATLLAYEITQVTTTASGVMIICLMAIGGLASCQSRGRPVEQAWSAGAQALIILLALTFHFQTPIASLALLASLTLGVMLYERTRAPWTAIMPAIALAALPPMLEALFNWSHIAAATYGAIGLLALITIYALANHPRLRLIFMTAAPLVTLVGFMHTLASGQFTSAGVLMALVGGLCLLTSYLLHRYEILHIGVAAIALGSLIILLQEMSFSLACTITGGAITLVGGFYTWQLYQRGHYSWRWWYCALCWIVPLLGLGGTFSARQDYTLYGVALGLVGAGLLAGLQRLYIQRWGYEFGLYTATLFLQIAYGTIFDQTYFLVYTHWWAASIMAPILWRTYARDEFRARLVIGLSLVTIPSAFQALEHAGGYSWLFLIEHALLVVAGALGRSRLATLWGAVGASLAVAWFVRDYAFFSLFIIAATLVGIALMQLRKDNPSAS